MRKAITLSVGLIAGTALCSCSGHDNDYFPYQLKGFNSYVYDMDKNQEYSAGFVPATYSSRQDGLASCARLASSAAASWNIEKWSYVCCTVTKDSQCATKVR